MNNSYRDAVLAAWRASSCQADARGDIVLTAPAFAGFLLDVSEGNPTMARQLVPSEPSTYWARVRDALDAVSLEEAPLRSIGGSIR